MNYVRLEDVCSSNSSNIAQKDLADSTGSYPIYGASGLIKNVDFYKQDKKYIAVVKDGAGIGRTYLLPAKSSVIGTMQYIIPNDNIDVSYLYYAITFMRLEKYFSGTTIPHIYFKDYKREKLPLPSMEKQKKISAILGKIDSLIEIRKVEYQKLEQLIKSRFMELFGDPVQNPYSFDTGTIRDVVSEVKYGTSAPANESGKYPYLRMGNITYDGYLDLNNLKYIDVDEKELSKYVVQKGDVLFNRTNSKELVGKTCVFDIDTPMVIAGYIIRVRTNKRVLPEYLSAVLNSYYGKQTLMDMCKAIVGQANINAQELQDIKLIIPPIDLQIKYRDFKKKIDNKSKFEIQKSLDKLEMLKKSLMQEYFA